MLALVLSQERMGSTLKGVHEFMAVCKHACMLSVDDDGLRALHHLDDASCAECKLTSELQKFTSADQLTSMKCQQL